MSDKAREAAARAICENDSDETWEEEIDSSRAHYRRLACAAIDAYFAARREEGFVEVPREPTEAMVMHGAAALEPNTFYIDGPPEGRKRQALMAYRAMLKAAEPPPTSQR